MVNTETPFFLSSQLCPLLYPSFIPLSSLRFSLSFFFCVRVCVPLLYEESEQEFPPPPFVHQEEQQIAEELEKRKQEEEKCRERQEEVRELSSLIFCRSIAFMLVESLCGGVYGGVVFLLIFVYISLPTGGPGVTL